jgi:AbrB family looped-hinge helix DNA binding protein
MPQAPECKRAPGGGFLQFPTASVLFVPQGRMENGLQARQVLTCLIDKSIVIRNQNDEGDDMQTVKVSPKYQVVIPRAVRNSLRVRPGQKMQVVEYAGRIELIPERDIREMRGFVKGINTAFEREKDRL